MALPVLFAGARGQGKMAVVLLLFLQGWRKQGRGEGKGRAAAAAEAVVLFVVESEYKGNGKGRSGGRRHSLRRAGL